MNTVLTIRKLTIAVLILVIGLIGCSESEFQALDPSLAPDASDTQAFGVDEELGDDETGTTPSSAMSGGAEMSVLAQFDGNVDYAVIGNSESTVSVPGRCGSENNRTSASLELPENGQVLAAYLNWAGTGSSLDSAVTLNDETVSAEREYVERMQNGSSNFYFWSASADVTDLVSDGGDYTVGELSWDNSSRYCRVGAAYGGWTLTVVYESDESPLSEINVYEGHRQQWGVGTMTHTLGGLDIDECGSVAITGVAWDADHYKTEELSINGVRFGGDNPYASETASDLDIDTYDLTEVVSVGDTSISYDFYVYAQNTQYGRAAEGATNTVFVVQEEKCEPEPVPGEVLGD